MIMDYLVNETSKNIDISTRLENIKSSNSINQINRLHRTLITLEEKCNMKVAENYLIGFLEQNGVNSYQDYIDSLV